MPLGSMFDGRVLMWVKPTVSYASSVKMTRAELPGDPPCAFSTVKLIWQPSEGRPHSPHVFESQMSVWTTSCWISVAATSSSLIGTSSK
jgi:hypothetical protein